MSNEAAGVTSEALPAPHEMSDEALIAQAVAKIDAEGEGSPASEGEPEAEPGQSNEPEATDGDPEGESPQADEGESENEGGKNEGEIESKPEADPALERSWSKLEKKEQQLWQRELALKQTEKENELLKDKLNKLEGSLSSFDAMARQSPIKFMHERFGVTPQQLANALLEGGDIAPQQPQRQDDSEVAQLRKQLEELQKQTIASQQQAYITQYRGEVAQALAGEQFELLRGLPGGGADFVMEVASIAAQQGQVLAPAEAAERALGRYREQLNALKANEAVVRYLTGSSTPASKQDSGKSGEPKEGGRPRATLSNSLTTRTHPKRIPDDEIVKMSEEELIAHAARLVEEG